MASRPKIPQSVEAGVLLRCRRRCAICFGMDRCASVRRGQIAHLDHDRSNNKPENLVFLCLEHHDLYDSRTSQSKGLTVTEVKVFRAELEEALLAALAAPLMLDSQQNQAEQWEGVFRWEADNASAEIRIEHVDSNHFSLFGIAFWGTRHHMGPNIGELDAKAEVEDGCLVYEENCYILRLRLTEHGISAEESPRIGIFGMNVTFAGEFRRLPKGGEALPQPAMDYFETEFWPDEGVPVFHAICENLVLHSRPTSDSPIIGTFAISLNSKIQFKNFRYRTIRPGRVLAHDEATLTGRNLGQTSYVSSANYYEDGGETLTLSFVPGNKLEYLQYRAEGSGFVRWQGIVLDVDYLPWLGSESPFELVVEPVAESWIRVDRGESSGWLLIDENIVEVDREF